MPNIQCLTNNSFWRVKKESMASTQRDSKILFFFPLVLIGVIISIDIVRGPDWFISYSENAYIMLVQGLRTYYNNSLILKAIAIPLTAIVCPFMIWIISSIRGVDNVTYDLLSNPEVYLGVMRYLLILFVFFSIVISGRLAWRYTGSLWIALFFQAMPFCFGLYGYLLGLTLTVDLIHLGVGLLLGAILIPFALTNENISKGYVRVLCVSALCGFGTACKITFFPATITALLLVPTLRNKGFFLLAFSIVFWGLQLPFVNLHDLLQSWVPANTVFSQENKVFVNYFNMLWLNFTNMVSNHSGFYFLYLYFYVLAAFLFRFLLALLAKTFSFEKLRVALILNTGLISAIIFVSLRPADWYFIPMVGIFGLALCEAVIGLATDINKFFQFSLRSCQKALVLLTAFFLVVLISYKAVISDIVVFKMISNNRIISYQKLELLEKDYSQAGVILFQGANHPYSALFHSLLSYGGGIEKDQLQRIIPDRFYHMFDHDFINFYNAKGEKFNLNELRARHKELLFLGSAFLLEKKYLALLI